MENITNYPRTTKDGNWRGGGTPGKQKQESKLGSNILLNFRKFSDLLWVLKMGRLLRIYSRSFEQACWCYSSLHSSLPHGAALLGRIAARCVARRYWYFKISSTCCAISQSFIWISRRRHNVGETLRYVDSPPWIQANWWRVAIIVLPWGHEIPSCSLWGWFQICRINWKYV